LIQADGSVLWTHSSPIGDFRARDKIFSVSADGTVIDFSFEQSGKSLLRFDLNALKLSNKWPTDDRTHPLKQDGLLIEDWYMSERPTLGGKPIELDRSERAQSRAIHPDGHRFVLGADWSLRAYNAEGKEIWKRVAPEVARAVNITGDGRLVVAAYDDGTIRWHRMDDGREILALMVQADKSNWVAWTPEGFYGATPGAYGVLRWHVNHGFDAAGEAVPASTIRGLRRPYELALVLRELESMKVFGIAALISARKDVQLATRAAKVPGARLHVLTIGISDYGDKARDLKLKFAARDAKDMASALINTQQDGGLYAEVKPQFLHDGTANKDGIFEALDLMERNMATATGGDLAVIMFSGHGTMIDGQFYLVPYGVDDSTPARLRSSAIPGTEFKRYISKLATHGRVLVLLDACRSGGLIGTALPDADVFRSMLAASNVTVLTSSMADKLSREDEKWQHGAFTKVLLDALGSADDIDTDRNGVISMAELTAYVAKHLDELTGGDQQLGLEQRFLGDVRIRAVSYAQCRGGAEWTKGEATRAATSVPRDPISLVIAITVMVRSCSLNSIKEGYFLVARCVPALVNVRVVAVQRNHGGNGS
jgi:hypothetical protein